MQSKVLRLPAAALSLLLAAPLMAVEPAAQPPREPGALEPWQEPQIRPGDRWAKLRLHVDRKGRATKCGIIASNVHKGGNMRFLICNAFMTDWHMPPAMENGVPVETTVVRTVILPGRSTADAWEKAKKRSRR